MYLQCVRIINVFMKSINNIQQFLILGCFYVFDKTKMNQKYYVLKNFKNLFSVVKILPVFPIYYVEK